MYNFWPMYDYVHCTVREGRVKSPHSWIWMNLNTIWTSHKWAGLGLIVLFPCCLLSSGNSTQRCTWSSLSPTTKSNICTHDRKATHAKLHAWRPMHYPSLKKPHDDACFPSSLLKATLDTRETQMDVCQYLKFHFWHPAFSTIPCMTPLKFKGHC